MYHFLAIPSICFQIYKINHLPSHSLSKPSCWYIFISFTQQYDLLPSITYHNILSHCNPFYSKPHQPDLSYTISLHSVPVHCHQFLPFQSWFGTSPAIMLTNIQFCYIPCKSTGYILKLDCFRQLILVPLVLEFPWWIASVIASHHLNQRWFGIKPKNNNQGVSVIGIFGPKIHFFIVASIFLEINKCKSNELFYKLHLPSQYYKSPAVLLPSVHFCHVPCQSPE